MTGITKASHPRRPSVFWLIVKENAEQEEVLTLDLDGDGETLPVFCFEDEANMFLSLGTLGAEWRTRESTAGEFTRMFLGPWSEIEFVSLDPLPELVYQRMIGLVNVTKEQFMDSLVNNARSRKSTAAEEAEGRQSIVGERES